MSDRPLEDKDFRQALFVNVRAVHLPDLIDMKPGKIIRIRGKVTENILLGSELETRFQETFIRGLLCGLGLGMLVLILWSEFK